MRYFEGYDLDIYVGNLSQLVKEEDLKTAFEAYGEVSSVRLMKAEVSDISRGFAFVEMPDIEQAKNAISELNRKYLKGKRMSVNEALSPRNSRRRGTRSELKSRSMRVNEARPWKENRRRGTRSDES